MSKSKTPAVTFANGRWAVGGYSTSLPNKLINHLAKRYQVEISLPDLMALSQNAPASDDAPVTAAPETPETPDNDKEI
ncbi:MAG: hypothetical protein KDK05_00570 [Candidatus Competibacteraceae bacterium]|nr:hypothetical protein [Anaerolineales bacterium]MCB1713611.1 hypothetical protein [Candidatus Competibacteraceae bacterium]